MSIFKGFLRVVALATVVLAFAGSVLEMLGAGGGGGATGAGIIGGGGGIEGADIGMHIIRTPFTFACRTSPAGISLHRLDQ